MPSFSRRRAIDWWKGGAVLWWDMCDGRRSGKGSPCGAVRWETGRCACWRGGGRLDRRVQRRVRQAAQAMADAGVVCGGTAGVGGAAASPFGSRPRWRAAGHAGAAGGLRLQALGTLPVTGQCGAAGLPATGPLRRRRICSARRVRYLSPQLGRGAGGAAAIPTAPVRTGTGGRSGGAAGGMLRRSGGGFLPADRGRAIRRSGMYGPSRGGRKMKPWAQRSRCWQRCWRREAFRGCGCPGVG